MRTTCLEPPKNPRSSRDARSLMVPAHGGPVPCTRIQTPTLVRAARVRCKKIQKKMRKKRLFGTWRRRRRRRLRFLSDLILLHDPEPHNFLWVVSCPYGCCLLTTIVDRHCARVCARADSIKTENTSKNVVLTPYPHYGWKRNS